MEDFKDAMTMTNSGAEVPKYKWGWGCQRSMKGMSEGLWNNVSNIGYVVLLGSLISLKLGHHHLIETINYFQGI